MHKTIILEDYEIEVEVAVSVFGSYCPATLYQPEDFPEIEIESCVVVTVLDEGKFVEGEDVTRHLNRDDYDALAVAAYDYERDQRQYAWID